MDTTKDQLRKSLNDALLKSTTTRAAIDHFKIQTLQLLHSIRDNETEEFHKNSLSDFLKETYYKPHYYINTKGNNDLVIHHDKSVNSAVGVIIEVKRPSNKTEMVSCEELNKKALHELVLYYLRERITAKNLQLKHFIITNLNEWFIFDAEVFENCFAKNKTLVKLFIDFENGTLADNKTTAFYKDIASPVIEACQSEIEFTYFNLAEYQTLLENTDKEKDTQLIPLFKVLSPEHLLKLSFHNDANSLNQEFYDELLHLMGLEEVKEAGKKLIKRKKIDQRNFASLVEQIIEKVKILSEITQEEALFEIAIELSITWINRILFLKLLEAQLLIYHQQDKTYQFLQAEKLTCFSDLNHLFFEVLAVAEEQRNAFTQQQFAHIPYLNSSLFERTALEKEMLDISQLRRLNLPLLPTTVLKNPQGKKRHGELDILAYLFEFLDAYNFANDSKEVIQEENKTLISSSVLGLIFEKLNGYKDGSFFTPSLITMYMSRETIRLAVLQKFNEVKQWQCQNFTELYNAKKDLVEANQIINSLKICDPAVGSGHFLVSVLNEILAIKSELEILLDRHGKRLNYRIEVVNDDLKITPINDDTAQFIYDLNNQESQRVQEALFHEKQTLIENCLFGVDINPNSVKICRLRLWIELLKQAYYHPSTDKKRRLETLPNIDINIQCGNTLISRFNLNEALNKHQANIDSYKKAIHAYQAVTDKAEKKRLEKTITELKNSFFKGLHDDNLKKLKLTALKAKLADLKNLSLIEESVKEKKAREKQIQIIEGEITQLNTEIENILSHQVYANAVEWRFIFPEVLNALGDFVGFDVIITNPPYIQIQNFSGQEIQTVLQNKDYATFEKTGDIYTLFIEKGIALLKPGGLCSVITSNKWMRANYGQALRKLLATTTQPLTLIDFGDSQLFKNATTYTNILITQNSLPHFPLKACAIADNYTPKMDLAAYFAENVQVLQPIADQAWVIASIAEQQLKTKIEANATPLKKWDVSIYRGILTGFNEAFIIDNATKERLCNEDIKSAEIIKPILRGRDIKRYSAKWADLWLINTHNNPAIALEDYPVIQRHLAQFYAQLEKRQDKGITPYHLRHCAYLKDFAKEKIIWLEMSPSANFTLDTTGAFVLNTAYILISPFAKYLLAILNSKLLDFYFLSVATEVRGGTRRYIKQYVEQMPIPKITELAQQPLIELVDKILIAKKEAKNTQDLETQLDNLVYALYDLNAEEIALVEEKTAQ